MAKKETIASIFPKHLFWDMDLNSLDIQADEDIIIPRALYMTNKRTFEEDIKRLEKFYSATTISTQLQHTKEFISNEVCAMVAQRYSIPAFFRFSRK